jgi:hypothetical protein
MRLVFLSWFICRFPLPFVKFRWECHDCGHAWKASSAEDDSGTGEGGDAQTSD